MISRSDADLLLNWLCSDLGFCDLGPARATLVESPPDSPSDFTRAVYLAEGLDPDLADRHLFRQVLAKADEVYRDGWSR